MPVTDLASLTKGADAYDAVAMIVGDYLPKEIDAATAINRILAIVDTTDAVDLDQLTLDLQLAP